MRKSLVIGLILGLSAYAASVGAEQTATMRVESSRSMKVAVINLDKRNPANAELHQAFAESLGFEISRRCKMPVPLKPVVRDAPDAAFGLSNGVYDMVVVIGASIPAALVNSDFLRLKATPVSGNPKHLISLVLRNDDPALTTVLEQSFPEALKGVFFQKALLGYSGQSLEKPGDEWKITDAAVK